MSESIKNMSFSTMRRKLRSFLKTKRRNRNGNASVDFVPTDLRIWIGGADLFHRTFCHHRMILKLILSGSASIFIDGVRFHLSQGDAVLYFPMQTHSTEAENDRNFEYLAITFVESLGHYSALEPLKNRVFTPDPENRFLPEIVSAWKQGNDLHAECLLAEILSAAAARSSVAATAGDREFLAITEFIRKNCLKEISVKTLAAEFSISPQSVRRIFRRNLCGLTPSELIRGQRLVWAEDMLRRTDLPLQQIAKQCGFTTAFSFSKAFTKMNGVSPSKYRKTSKELESP